MRSIVPFIIALFLSVSLLGCSSSVQSSIEDYSDDEVAAIVRDKEITIGELRFLYPDDKILGNIEGIVKFELMLQEAKRMNLDVSEDIKRQKDGMLMLDINDPISAFVESQAQKLGMETEEYYKRYLEIRSEQIAYTNAFTQKMLGEPDAYSEGGLEEFNKKANDFLNKLVKEHKKEIKILIK